MSSDVVKIGEVSSRWCKSTSLPYKYEAKTSSTNEVAKAEAFEEAAEETIKVYLTDEQTEGRGRGQNKWQQGAAGSAFLSSWSFALQDPPQPQLTPKIGLALMKACSSTWPFMPWSLKAPNDLYLHNKKVAGLLVEVVQEGQDHRLIIGLGLNVWDAPLGLENSTYLTKELPEKSPLLGEDWIHFLERWLFELTEAVGQFDQKLTSTECASLKYFLNLREGTLVDEVLSDGSLKKGSELISWKSL